MNIDMMSKNAKSSEELLEEIDTKLDKVMDVLAVQGKDEDHHIRNSLNSNLSRFAFV